MFVSTPAGPYVRFNTCRTPCSFQHLRGPLFVSTRNMLEAVIFTPGLVAEELVLFEDQTGNQEGRGCVGVEGPRSFSSLFTDALIQRQVMIFSYLLVNTLLTMKVISGQNTSESLVDSWRLATICLKRIGKKSI